MEAILGLSLLAVLAGLSAALRVRYRCTSWRHTRSNEEIVRLYGSAEAYNEEQRRCGLTQIEAQLARPPSCASLWIAGTPLVLPTEPTPISTAPRRDGLRSLMFSPSA